MRFRVNRRIKMPIYMQLKEQIRHLIAVGELKPGTQLPPASQLANNLLINRHTVLKAYNELVQQSYVESRNGRGTFVAKATPAAGAETISPELLAQFDTTIEAAIKNGLTPEQISYMVLSRAETLATQTAQVSPTVSVALFECNSERLNYYASALAESLAIVIRPYLITDLADTTVSTALTEVDFVITSFFHLVEVRRIIRRFPELKQLEIYAITVRPHLDVLSRLAELPHGSHLGVLFFAGTHYTEKRLRAMVEHIENANLKNVRLIEPIYVQGELRLEMLREFDALLVRPENLADSQKYLDLSIPIIEYNNVLDKASVAMLREVVRDIREDKVAANNSEQTGVSEKMPL